MPRSFAPRALLGVVTTILILSLMLSSFVDARPKDKQGGKREEVAAETVPIGKDDQSGKDGQSDSVDVESVPDPAQALPVPENGGGKDERTLLSADADGDYIPDSLDNCASVQNPDQADGDGDGHGDACPVYQDSDGDTVPDKSDNCPNIATSDFTDTDGDGVGDSCDKSPDGIEPEPEPAPDLNGRGGEGQSEPPAPENGENQDGESYERSSRSRSKQRDRTDIAKPSISVGEDGQQAGAEEAADPEPQNDRPVRDNPRINEELIAEAAASGELYAPPEPPPVPQRAWDEPDATDRPVEWQSLIRIDAGATNDPQDVAPEDAEPNDARPRDTGRANDSDRGSVADSEFARGWVRAKLILLEESDPEPGDGEFEPGDGGPESDPSQAEKTAAPVPVESGLVISGVEEPARSRETDDEKQTDGNSPSNSNRNADGKKDARASDSGNERAARDGGNDGSRRNGSARGPAAGKEDTARADERATDRQSDRGRGRANGWDDDRYFEGGAALNWSAEIDVDGTDDDALYLTQRSGSGPGKKRGFGYAIPVQDDGTYLLRLYFAEPYWGAPGGPDGAAGKRIFSVTAEGDTILRELDVYDEVGAVTALVKEVEVEVTDGELNLRFTASEGEPIVAAIEILEPAN